MLDFGWFQFHSQLDWYHSKRFIFKRILLKFLSIGCVPNHKHHRVLKAPFNTTNLRLISNLNNFRRKKCKNCWKFKLPIHLCLKVQISSGWYIFQSCRSILPCMHESSIFFVYLYTAVDFLSQPIGRLSSQSIWPWTNLKCVFFLYYCV